MSHFQFEQIDVIRSPYKGKFAVPYQPGLVKSANGELHLFASYNQTDAVRDLKIPSRSWVIFVFHQIMEGGRCPTVRPSRLGGNARMGTFTMCSTSRSNPAGMSLIEPRGIRCHKEHVILELGGLDLVDGTPVAGIKPYLLFAEPSSNACANYVQGVPKVSMDVTFSEDLAEQLPKLEQRYPHLRRLTVEALAQDPRPAHRRDEEEGRTYAV